ncbi:hypothetical protein [Hyalangium gracile]|uniref:hypothetical protein n=1 Tax=Hyalangium gracile TaxID=394092 RepID=UPI001CCEAEFF|nr:hypothetical protein [Hyalangium gracile]
MKALYLSLSLLLCSVLFGAASGCVVDFPDELPYTCETDADCGGKGYLCTALPDTRRYCCLPEAEQCNKLDDDCNGQVDDLTGESCYTGSQETLNVGSCRPGKPVCGEGNIRCLGEVLPSTELCNGRDDDCDGTVDEGFDFQTSRETCGRCDQACGTLEDCVSGQCARRREVACDNTQDDDTDGDIDCVDTDCNSLPCGPGCTCIARKKAETDCNNQADDEGDGLIDCLDPDCDSRSCGPGCQCLNLTRGEADCINTVNDDGDAQTDCADSDCNEKSCGEGCFCRNNVKAEDLCDDNLDNDGDGTMAAPKTDCQDNDCVSKPCGVGCLCVAVNTKKEVVCSDKLDNDGDGTMATPRTDCQDSDCNGEVCAVGGGARCTNSACAEINCADTLDNDGDGLVDCADTMDCSTCGPGCTCVSGVKKETQCADTLDNDGDGLLNCADPDCNGVACGGNRTCTNSTCQ